MNIVEKKSLRPLYTKLLFAFTGITAAVGLSILIISQLLMLQYFEEFTQKLNASIGMYINDTYQLIHDKSDKPDTQVLAQLAETAMVINPMAEVYVLDLHGHIIGHNFPPSSVFVDSIPLTPISEFIDGSERYPLKNVDPRNQQVDKIFSAAEIRNAGKLQGYIYVVLGGETFDSIESRLLTSYSWTQLVTGTGLIVIAAILGGSLIVKLIILPLSSFSNAIKEFDLDDIENNPPLPNIKKNSFMPKEVALIDERFNKMRAKIHDQFHMLREADRLKRELISNISHDLRTPLTSIEGYIDTLVIKDGTLSNQERQHYLNTARKSALRLNRLITDLFELSKLESNFITPVKEEFSLAELVHDLVQEFELEFERKKIIVEVINPIENSLVYADISMTHRVFENLIRNAITHTPMNGRISLQIDAGTYPIEKQVKICVSDSGSGIDPNDIPHIFDRYYRCSNKTKSQSDSTGLGLTIVKRILEMHESHIEVDSQLNQGSSFTFYLRRISS